MDEAVVRALKGEEERAHAAALIARVYAQEGYADSDLSGGVQKKFQELLSEEGTVSFGVFDGSVLVGTISSFAGNGALPMEAIYEEEIAGLRKEGHRIAEIGCFAVDKEYLRTRGSAQGLMLAATTLLMKAVLSENVRAGSTALSIAINPKHEPFYASLGFEAAGGLKTYPSVNHAPALAKVLKLGEILERYQKGEIKNGFLRDILSAAYRETKHARPVF